MGHQGEKESPREKKPLIDCAEKGRRGGGKAVPFLKADPWVEEADPV